MLNKWACNWVLPSWYLYWVQYKCRSWHLDKPGSQSYRCSYLSCSKPDRWERSWTDPAYIMVFWQVSQIGQTIWSICTTTGFYRLQATIPSTAWLGIWEFGHYRAAHSWVRLLIVQACVIKWGEIFCWNIFLHAKCLDWLLIKLEFWPSKSKITLVMKIYKRKTCKIKSQCFLLRNLQMSGENWEVIDPAWLAGIGNTLFGKDCITGIQRIARKSDG